jgi:mono/diheme cytochrome c family protein
VRLIWGFLAGLAVAVGAAAAVPAFAPDLIWSRSAAAPAGYAPDPERGAYVYAAGGCAACHAAPDADGKAGSGPPVGGLTLTTPFGRFTVPNITPDPLTGIGGWTDQDFVNAMALGLSPDGRHYYPAFPYGSYARASVADLLDLKAYLDGLDPVANPTPPHDLGFPFSIREGLGLWKVAFFDPAPFRPDPGRSAEENRGAYLVNGLGHCAECHTARNPFGGLERGLWLAGSPVGPDGKPVPNLTPHPKGLAGWSAGDIDAALSLGFTPGFDAIGRDMAPMIRESTSKLTPQDRAAMAAYLMSLPPLSYE